MAAPYARNMPYAATYWPPAGNDGFGGLLYGAPAALLCRWQDVAELFRDALGREVTSSSVVYVSEEVANGGRLLLGASADPAPPAAAKEIRQTGRSPNLGGARELHKVWL